MKHLNPSGRGMVLSCCGNECIPMCFLLPLQLLINVIFIRKKLNSRTNLRMQCECDAELPVSHILSLKMRCVISSNSAYSVGIIIGLHAN